MKPKATPRKKPSHPPTVPSLYRDLKSLRRQTGLYDPFDFRDYLQTRLRRLKPETVKAIAKYHRMKRQVADPEMVALWLVPHSANSARIWRPNFPFLCVARRLQFPELRPPRALMKGKFGSPIRAPFADCGTAETIFEKTAWP